MSHEPASHIASAPVVQPAVVHHHHIGPIQEHQPPVGVVGVPHYAPADKPIKPSGYSEQYGQPEPTQIPANYKPFGSWGLYIGGNPQDGYYTNYYKALSNSVEKQQQSGGFEGAKPISALSPILRQAGSSPYGGDYYPFAYSSAELNSAVGPIGQPIAPQPGSVSPVQAGAQIYGAPAVFESAALPEHYATKKIGATKSESSSNSQHQYQVKGQQQVHQVKGHQQPSYFSYYSQPAVGQLANQQVVQGVVQGAQQAIYAYPVPVGSQIVGSQQGVDGAFSPYGVHAFTRYAVKPAVVSSQEANYYPQVAPQVQVQAPVYKQQQVYQPLSFYGYPLSQIGYAPVPSVYAPAVAQQQVVHQAPAEFHQAPISPVQAGSSSFSSSQVSQSEDKQEVDEKAYGTKH